MKRLLATVGLVFVGALIGCIIGWVFDSGSVTGYAWFFAGVPIGWNFLSKYFGYFVCTNLHTHIFLFIMRVALAGLIGWVLIPVEIIRSLIEFFSGNGE
ncbi:MAG: hypothetical protein K2M73_10740 [Lachnospiraceae bacterium]|nr:hypothetical protein [Lachnospiraceae bacterium]MDE6698805.1 hypothetical protein [Lachnospiraceae bacterium]